MSLSENCGEPHGHNDPSFLISKYYNRIRVLSQGVNSGNDRKKQGDKLAKVTEFQFGGKWAAGEEKTGYREGSGRRFHLDKFGGDML